MAVAAVCVCGWRNNGKPMSSPSRPRNRFLSVGRPTGCGFWLLEPRKPRGYVFLVETARKDPGHMSGSRSEEHTSALQSRDNLVCRLPLEKISMTSVLFLDHS